MALRECVAKDDEGHSMRAGRVQIDEENRPSGLGNGLADRGKELELLAVLGVELFVR